MYDVKKYSNTFTENIILMASKSTMHGVHVP